MTDIFLLANYVRLFNIVIVDERSSTEYQSSQEENNSSMVGSWRNILNTPDCLLAALNSRPLFRVVFFV